MLIRAAIAEDEPLARARLSRLLQKAGCELVAEFMDGTSLLQWLAQEPSLDVLFLDVNMPGPSGIEVKAELPDSLPVIFVTASPEHAVAAFDHAALDFLVKPVTPERLAKALARLHPRVQPRNLPQNPSTSGGEQQGVAPQKDQESRYGTSLDQPDMTGCRSPLQAFGADQAGSSTASNALSHTSGTAANSCPGDTSGGPPSRPTGQAAQASKAPSSAAKVPVKAGDGVLLLDLKKLSHFEVIDEVVWVWSGQKKFRTLWASLNEVEQAFPGQNFLRVQRHVLIRPELILGLRHPPNGKRMVLLPEGLELEISRSAFQSLRERFGI